MKYFELRGINVLDSFKYGISHYSLSFMVAGHGMSSSNFESLTLCNGAKTNPLDLCISNILFKRSYLNKRNPSKPIYKQFILCAGSLHKLVDKIKKLRNEGCTFELLSEFVYYHNEYNRFINVLDIPEIATWPLEDRKAFSERWAAVTLSFRVSTASSLIHMMLYYYYNNAYFNTSV